ncbi:hypothetical protein HanIR_Chr08g0364311 [Helianthus annuus]|nr:hypothetical protein HanIR_Chr08g0364311 [Helianthus annuus]
MRYYFPAFRSVCNTSFLSKRYYVFLRVLKINKKESGVHPYIVCSFLAIGEYQLWLAPTNTPSQPDPI